MAKGVVPIRPAAHQREGSVYEYHEPLVLLLRPAVELTPDQLLHISSLNPELRIEFTSKGELVVMPPAGGGSSSRNMNLSVQLGSWAKHDGSGVAFDSSGGFILPNTALRSPDVSWVRSSRLEALDAATREKYLPLCPDFVAELRSPSDSLSGLQEKMEEYIQNGARLGWVLDPENRRVYVYRPGERPQRLDNPEEVSADPVLPGFILDLGEIW